MTQMVVVVVIISPKVYCTSLTGTAGGSCFRGYMHMSSSCDKLHACSGAHALQGQEGCGVWRESLRPRQLCSSSGCVVHEACRYNQSLHLPVSGAITGHCVLADRLWQHLQGTEATGWRVLTARHQHRQFARHSSCSQSLLWDAGRWWPLCGESTLTPSLWQLAGPLEVRPSPCHGM